VGITATTCGASKPYTVTVPVQIQKRGFQASLSGLAYPHVKSILQCPKSHRGWLTPDSRDAMQETRIFISKLAFYSGI